MQYEWTDGRLELRRSPDEKEPLLQRLRRIEGQVRGLQQMIEQDRYCLDEMQQVNAIISAVRETALIIVSEHVTAGLDRVAREGDGAEAVEEMKRVLRAAMRQG